MYGSFFVSEWAFGRPTPSSSSAMLGSLTSWTFEATLSFLRKARRNRMATSKATATMAPMAMPTLAPTESPPLVSVSVSSSGPGDAMSSGVVVGVSCVVEDSYSAQIDTKLASSNDFGLMLAYSCLQCAIVWGLASGWE